MDLEVYNNKSPEKFEKLFTKAKMSTLHKTVKVKGKVNVSD
jgi:hypothetical protein